MAELAPPSQRGWLILAVPSVGFIVGQITVLLTGLVAMHTETECEENCGWWRWVFGVGVVPDSIAFLCFLLYIPESPRYLLLAGRPADAEAVVRRIAVANGSEARLRAGGRVRALPPGAAGRATAWELFAPPLAGDMLLIMAVWTLFGFGLFGLNFLAPVLLETVFHLSPFWQASGVTMI
jgi:hypothetical protein